MRRDWETIREILMKVANPDEKNRFVKSPQDSITIPHVYLLANAGFLAGAEMHNEKTCSTKGLTWQGYELLAALEPEHAWEHIKSKLVTTNGSATLPTIQRWSDEARSGEEAKVTRL